MNAAITVVPASILEGGLSLLVGTVVLVQDIPCTAVTCTHLDKPWLIEGSYSGTSVASSFPNIVTLLGGHQVTWTPPEAWLAMLFFFFFKKTTVP